MELISSGFCFICEITKSNLQLLQTSEKMKGCHRSYRIRNKHISLSNGNSAHWLQTAEVTTLRFSILYATQICVNKFRITAPPQNHTEYTTEAFFMCNLLVVPFAICLIFDVRSFRIFYWGKFKNCSLQGPWCRMLFFCVTKFATVRMIYD